MREHPEVLSWFKPLVAGLLLRVPGFDPRPGHVGCVVDKVALGQVLLRVPRPPPPRCMTPLMRHISGLSFKFYNLSNRKRR
jgi:hypothetical protein